MAVRLSKEAKEIGLALYAVSIDETKEVNSRFSFLDKASAPVAALDKGGLVYFNMMLQDGGKVATVLSPDGVAHFKPLAEKASKATLAESGRATRGPSIDPALITIRKGVPIPPSPTRARRQSAWGWERFDVGDSVFIPVTSDRPEPWKSLLSTINTASRKFAKLFDDAKAKGDPAALAPDAKPRRFQIVEATEDGVKGALIHRTA